MALLDVVHYGDPILRKECKTVTNYKILPDIIEDMFDTMYEEEGIGLAANQVGIDMNLMIIDVSHTDEAEDANIFVNGEIIDSYGSSEMEEGCLSIPEVRLPVKRPEKIKFKYQLPDGSEHVDEFNGLLGRAIQHEMDHLKGVFIIDRVNPLLAMKYKKKLKELKPEFEKTSTLFHSKAEVEDLYQSLSKYAAVNGLVISKIEKKKPKAVLKAGIAAQADNQITKEMVSYYKIPVDYEIKGNFLGFIKFKRAISRSQKMLNFDKETISVVQNDSTGAIVARGELTIVGLPNEFF